MTIEQIKEMVNGSAYDFLRTNEHLGRKIIFLTLVAAIPMERTSKHPMLM